MLFSWDGDIRAVNCESPVAGLVEQEARKTAATKASALKKKGLKRMPERVQSVFAMMKNLIPCVVVLLAGFSVLPAYGQQDDNTFPMRQVTPVQPVEKEWDITGPERSEWIDDNPLKQPRERVSPEQPEFGVSPELSSLDGRKTSGQADFSALMPDGTESVDQVIDPLRVRMANGKIVQLAGLDIPDLDAYEPGDVSLAARDRLQQVLKNKQVRLYITKDPRQGRSNRLGYKLVHMARTDDGLWIQGDLLSAGLARVRPSERNPEMAAQMIAKEDQARAEGKGLWADGKFPVLTPETADKAMNQWAVVEGTIRSAATANNTIYLNFGQDWHTDFTIGIDGAVRRDLSKNGINTLSLGGAKVRVRGWMESYNGPYIKLLNTAWLEILPPEAGKP